MLVIGVTGNIGSGKSTVCQILDRLGVVVIDADKVAQETYKPHSPTWQELINAFGRDILQPDGEIDRQKLADIVFSRPDALAQLNRIMHPEAQRLAQGKIEVCRQQGAKVVALEATLLIEAEWRDLVDTVWLVVVSEDRVVQRLTQHGGRDEAQVLARLKSQMPAEGKKKYADEIIYNNGDMNQLEIRVAELWHALGIN
jgi:dephospho-CoA kinase